MSRIETREHAMELLFQIGFRNDPISEQIDLFREAYPEVTEDEDYVENLTKMYLKFDFNKIKRLSQ